MESTLSHGNRPDRDGGHISPWHIRISSYMKSSGICPGSGSTLWSPNTRPINTSEPCLPKPCSSRCSTRNSRALPDYVRPPTSRKPRQRGSVIWVSAQRPNRPWVTRTTSAPPRCSNSCSPSWSPDRTARRAVTPARFNDITAAHEMPIEPGATYVFDLGYYDFAWWRRMHDAGCRIVTRLKINTSLTVRWEKLYDPGLPILSDRIGTLPERQAHNRHNPFQAEVREVQVRTETGTILRVLTNDLEAPVQEIADLYRRRWAIELFFRWIKQHLKIKKFMALSDNAIRIQVFSALI